MRFRAKRMIAVIGLVGIITSHPAFALDEVYSPDVEYRELSLEYNGSRTFDPHADKNDVEGHELALEAGLTSRWEVETSAGFANNDPGGSVKIQDVEIENRFQFFEAGENWLDSGMLVAYDLATQSLQPDSLEVKLLLQKDIGKITNTTNIGFTQDVGAYAGSGGPDYVFLSNTRYRTSPYFQPGIEIQSDLGQEHNLGNFNQQQHYIGPAIYGRLIGQLKYQIGYFAGISDAAAQSAARVLFEYEFHF